MSITMYKKLYSKHTCDKTVRVGLNRTPKQKKNYAYSIRSIELYLSYWLCIHCVFAAQGFRIIVVCSSDNKRPSAAVWPSHSDGL